MTIDPGVRRIVVGVDGSAESVAAQIILRPELAGETGPTISPVYPKAGAGTWFDVTIIVDHEHGRFGSGSIHRSDRDGCHSILHARLQQLCAVSP